jgi:hypothetical protein
MRALLQLLRGRWQLPHDRFAPVSPTPTFQALEEAKSGATDTGQALQSLDMSVSPTVDVSSIRAARAEVKGLLSDLSRVGPAVQQAASTQGVATANRKLGREFASRRLSSYADFELS